MTDQTTATSLGTGLLSWPGRERRTDRYGLVGLFPSATADVGIQFDAVVAGRRGTLRAEVLETRTSMHIGDLFRGLAPETPEVGEVITLGTGTAFVERYDGTEFVGVRPDDGRDADWLDPRALYRCHSQTVRLMFAPEVTG